MCPVHLAPHEHAVTYNILEIKWDFRQGWWECQDKGYESSQEQPFLGAVNWNGGRKGTNIRISHMITLINVKYLRSSGTYIIGP
jgi:hypothetical protein